MKTQLFSAIIGVVVGFISIIFFSHDLLLHIISGLVCGWMGWFGAELWLLRVHSNNAPLRKDLVDANAHLTAKLTAKLDEAKSHLIALIEAENALTRMEISSPQVKAVVAGYANRKASHLVDKGEYLYVEEYVEILERSLELCDESMFATSIILPDLWVQDYLYQNYLNRQGEKIRNSGLKITRVFVADSAEFHSNPTALEKLKEMHKKAAIELKFCDVEQLRRTLGGSADQYYKDFVRFSSKASKWVVDGGVPKTTQKSDDRKNLLKVVIDFRPESVENTWSTTEKWIRDYSIMLN